MVGAGASLIIAGIITENHNINNDPYGGLGTLDKTGPAILIIAGSGVAVGSIPLFISSAKNKKRAAAISFNNQPVLIPQQNAIALNCNHHSVLKSYCSRGVILNIEWRIAKNFQPRVRLVKLTFNLKNKIAWLS